MCEGLSKISSHFTNTTTTRTNSTNLLLFSSNLPYFTTPCPAPRPPVLYFYLFDVFYSARSLSNLLKLTLYSIATSDKWVSSGCLPMALGTEFSTLLFLSAGPSIRLSFPLLTSFTNATATTFARLIFKLLCYFFFYN